MILGEAGVGKTSLLPSTPKEGIPDDIPVLKEMQEAYTDLMFEFGCDHEMLHTYDWPMMYQCSNSEESNCRLILDIGVQGRVSKMTEGLDSQVSLLMYCFKCTTQR